MSEQDKQPLVTLDEDGEHILWSHQCNWKTFKGSLWHDNVPLPINIASGWTVESTDPLTVSPSILCMSCGTHGFWRNGAWVPA